MKTFFVVLVGLFSTCICRAQSYSIQCEYTCNHIHGLDMPRHFELQNLQSESDPL